ncbi:hypothetical protein [Limnobaculum xujianqingii]|uniref:hypothetical protein n=1 Tax=Limnobaculum xujianqingii TaxID=2738837 RepID=UPI00112821B7|nr:hypothetical protein [Limnobaculum xujianqingii]
MSNNASLLVNSGSGSSQVISLDTGKPIKIKFQPGSQYLLKNADDNYAPKKVTLQRNGDDLYVILDGEENPVIVAEDYYVSGNNQPFLGMGDDGQLYAYPAANEDGSLTSVSLSGAPQGDASYLFESAEYADSSVMSSWPWFLGAAIVGGAGIGYAIYDHNKDDGGNSSSFSPLGSQPETQPEAQPESEAGPEPQPEPEPEPLPNPGGAIDDTLATPVVGDMSSDQS